VNDASGSVQIQGDLSANTIYANTLFANTFEPARLNVGDISANRISVTDVSAVNLNAENLYVSGITAPIVTATRLNAGVILGTDSSLPIGTIANPSAINVTDARTTIQSADLSGDVYIGDGQIFGNLLLRGGTVDYPVSEIFPNTNDSNAELILRGSASSAGITITPAETQINNARVSSSGLLIDNGSIGTDSSNPNAIVIGLGGRTMIQNADLSGLVAFGQGTGYGQLYLEVVGTADNPIAVIYPNASDSSGSLNLNGNPGSLGISLRPGDTQLYNAHVVDRGLLIDNGTIGKTYTSNLNAIIIGDNRTMVQNADLSGTVSIGIGDASGALKIQSDATGQATMFVNTAELGQLTLGSSAINLNAVTITDKYTIIQKADLSGTVYIGDGDVSGALQLASGATGQATIQVNTPDSGQLVIGSSDTNPNAITITDTATTLKNVSFLGGLLLGNNGTIGSTVTNPRAITVTDTSGTIFQNRGDLSGTITIGNLSRGLRITGGDVSGTIQSFNTIRPTVAASGEVLIGSSTANQNAIRITDTATTLKNVSFLGGLILGNGGTIGSSTSNLNAIVVTDTSGTIFQNRGDSSGTISVGNPSIGALQLTSSSSGSTIRPTVASAGRLSIGSSTANPNMIVISDTSGTILQNRGDLSGTLFVGNPSRGLRITGGDASGTITSGFATIRPSVSTVGYLSLGSSTANPDAITITDTTTSIKNLSFSGGLLLGNNGTIGTTSGGSNASAITVSDTSGTIIQYLSPRYYKIPDFVSEFPFTNTYNTVLPGPGVYSIWSAWQGGPINTITTNSLNIPGRYVLAMQQPNTTKFDPSLFYFDANINIVTNYPQGTANTTTIYVEPYLTPTGTYLSNFYSFDLVSVTNVDVSNNGSSPYVPPVPERTGFIITNLKISSSLSESMYPLCASGGTVTLGSSQANRTAITITDSTTTIQNAISSSLTSSTGTLALGSSGANPSAISITNSLTTINNPSLGTPTVTDIATVTDAGAGTGNMLVGGNGGSSVRIQGGDGSTLIPSIRTSAISNATLSLGSSTNFPSTLNIVDIPGVTYTRHVSIDGTASRLKLTGAATNDLINPIEAFGCAVFPDISNSGMLILAGGCTPQGNGSTPNTSGIAITNTITRIRNSVTIPYSPYPQLGNYPSRPATVSLGEYPGNFYMTTDVSAITFDVTPTLGNTYGRYLIAILISTAKALTVTIRVAYPSPFVLYNTITLPNSASSTKQTCTFDIINIADGFGIANASMGTYV
jgi:hypothetical protein